MLVSALSYGNWITHGSQIEEDAAAACVKAALDAGITTFDTADVYAIGAAESVLGRALKHVRRESVEIFTKVYWPTGPNPNDRGLSRKHIIESLHASLGRLQTDHVDLLQAHRFDYEAPLEETLRAFDDLVRQGKVHYIGVSEWTAEQIAGRAAAGRRNGLRPHRLQPAAVLHDLAGDRGRDRPAVPEGGRRPDRLVTPGPGHPDRQVPARRVGAARRARGPPGPEGGEMSWLLRDEVLEPVQAYAALCREAGYTPASVALAWVLQNENVSSAIVGASRPEQIAENVKALDVVLEPDFVEAIEKALAPTTLFDPGFTLSPATRP